MFYEHFIAGTLTFAIAVALRTACISSRRRRFDQFARCHSKETSMQNALIDHPLRTSVLPSSASQNNSTGSCVDVWQAHLDFAMAVEERESG